MKKAIVIGANSYIARNLTKISSDRKDIEITALYDCLDHHFDYATAYQQINILDMDSLKSIDLDVDFIFFFTGKTGTAVGFDHYDDFIDVNEKALLNLLTEYRNQQSQAKIIFPSTRLVYKGKNGPLKEDSEKEFKTVYAINKFACEQYLEMYASVYGVNYSIFRICVPYGSLIPGASSYGTAEIMISRAKKGKNITVFGDGSVRRTLTYIGDICETLISGALLTDHKNDIFNIGGEDYSLFEMATLIAEKYNVAVEYADWPEVALKIESGDTVFDSGKLDRSLGNIRRQTFKEWILKVEN